MNETSQMKVPKRILNTLLSSLYAGVVPRVGAPYIAIGRTEEISAMLSSLDGVAEGGAAVRFLIGRYGSGKSFLIQLIRGYAMERNFLCADCDLSADQRRLCGGDGAGVATYRELLRNLACKAAPDGGALPTVLSKHYSDMLSRLAEKGIYPESTLFHDALRGQVTETFRILQNNVGGFDFSRVVSEYFFADAEDNEEKKNACLRWLRGEFANKTEARKALGFSVSVIVDDENWYDFIKLWAVFARHLGYAGLMVYIDECIVLYKIVNRVARESNYEKILTIFNDTLQGRAEGLGVVFGGTPQFLEDTARGLFSYEALRSRLADSRFAGTEYSTMSSPVIRLRRLSDGELLALLSRLTKLYAQKNGKPELVTAEEMQTFLSFCLKRVGATELVTPREIIRDFMTVLTVLDEHPDATFAKVMQSQKPKEESSAKDASEDKHEVGLADLDF